MKVFESLDGVKFWWLDGRLQHRLFSNICACFVFSSLQLRGNARKGFRWFFSVVTAMASRRRGVGVGVVQQKKEIQVSIFSDYYFMLLKNFFKVIRHRIQAKFQAKGTELASEQLSQFSQELAVFQAKLEEFAHKHRDEIRRNSQFRRHFQDMCASVGVDPLACKLFLAVGKILVTGRITKGCLRAMITPINDGRYNPCSVQD